MAFPPCAQDIHFYLIESQTFPEKLQEKQVDIEIAELAQDELASNLCIPHDQIMMTVEKGWIILEGQVDRCYEKEAAEGAVRSIMGVRGIRNLIVVRRKGIASGYQGTGILLRE